jgi:hypothetical protein
MNTHMVLNFIRSANAPQIRAGVMMKNIPWNDHEQRLAEFPVAIRGDHLPASHLESKVATTPFSSTWSMIADPRVARFPPNDSE